MGTPTFGEECRPPYIGLHTLTDSLAVPDCKFRVEYSIERENFESLRCPTPAAGYKDSQQAVL
jgi:hypothetical protein